MLREPELLEELLERISDGMTLREFARERDLSYFMTAEWLRGEGRSERYQAALTARDSAVADIVLGQLRGAAEVDVRRLFDKNGIPLAPHLMPDDVGVALAGVELEETATGGQRVRYKLTDKTRNAELLGKTIAMFRDRVEHSGGLTLEQLLSKAAEPVSGNGA